MWKEIGIGASSAVLAAMILGGLAKSTDWLDDALKPAVPPGAVMAFDLPDGCPTGWSYFKQGVSRVIVGAVETNRSEVMNLDEKKEALTPRTYQSTAGTEQHTLTPNQMPKHDHRGKPGQRFVMIDQNGDPKGDVDTKQGTAGYVDYHDASSFQAGDDKPHNNMPPYIALYFCKKES